MGKYDIFISYSTRDKLPVEICSKLEKIGLKCWIAPRDILPGVPYARSIMHALQEVSTVLIFISANSLQSEDVLNEIDNAHSLRKRIIPIFIEDVPLNLEFSYYLKRKQWINACDSPSVVVDKVCKAMGHMQKEITEPEAAKVYKAIGQPRREKSEAEVMKDGARYRVYLADVGTSTIPVARLLAETFNISLAQAKRMTDDCKQNVMVFLTIVDQTWSEKLKERFSKIGATLICKPTGVLTDPKSLEPKDTDTLRYEVYLKDPGPSKLAVGKYIKDYCGIPLGMAKKLVDDSRFDIVHFTTVENYREFTEIQKSLQEIGAIVVCKKTYTLPRR
ncbi:MAG: toll/interleukin-1 receptor domain-containing protein [Muribaculaceae bacterium]|nr:toll/interleukin-1 receptor domain-containing protein [Muribaculaceae bacterium]